MITKKQWDDRVGVMNKKLFNLYQRGEFNLTSLQEFRGLVNDMDSMMQKMFGDVRLSFGSSRVKKEIRRLNNEYLIFEYNLSLLSSAVA